MEELVQELVFGCFLCFPLVEKLGFFHHFYCCQVVCWLGPCRKAELETDRATT